MFTSAYTGNGTGLYMLRAGQSTHEKIVTTPTFDRFGEKLLALPVNRSVFDQYLC